MEPHSAPEPSFRRPASPSSGSIGDFWRIDVSDSVMAWVNVTSPDTPSPRYSHAATTAGGQPYMFGGLVGSGTRAGRNLARARGGAYGRFELGSTLKHFGLLSLMLGLDGAGSLRQRPLPLRSSRSSLDPHVGPADWTEPSAAQAACLCVGRRPALPVRRRRLQ